MILGPELGLTRHERMGTTALRLPIVINLSTFFENHHFNETFDVVAKKLLNLWILLSNLRSDQGNIIPSDLQKLQTQISEARTLLNKLDRSPNQLVRRKREKFYRALSRIDRIAGRLSDAQNPNIDAQPVRLGPLNAWLTRFVATVFLGSISFMPFGKASAQDGGRERRPHPTLIVGSDAPGTAGVQPDIIDNLLAEIESTLGDFEVFSYSVQNIVKAERAPEFGTTEEDIEDYLAENSPRGGDQPLSHLAEIRNSLRSVSSTSWSISSSIFDRFKNGSGTDTSNELSSLPEPSPEQERGSLNPVVSISVKLEQPVNVNPVSFSLEYDQENGVFIKLLNDEGLSIDDLRADEKFNDAYLGLIEQINLILEADPTVSSQAFSILVTSNSEIGRLGTTDNFNLAIMTSDVAERYGVAKNALLVVSTIDGVEQIVLAASPDGGAIVPIELESDVPGYSNLTWANNFNLENATGTAWISINGAGSPTYILFRNETGEVVWLPLVPKQRAALTSIEASSYAAQIVIPKPSINIRTEANTRSNSLGLTTGTEELLLDPSRKTFNDESFSWLPILYNGIPGWIREDVVLETKSINAVSHETNVEINAGTYDREFVSRFFSEALAVMPEKVTIHYIVDGEEESQEVSVDQNLFIIPANDQLVMLVSGLKDANGGPVPAAIWENGQLTGYQLTNGSGDLIFWTDWEDEIIGGAGSSELESVALETWDIQSPNMEIPDSIENELETLRKDPDVFSAFWLPGTHNLIVFLQSGFVDLMKSYDIETISITQDASQFFIDRIVTEYVKNNIIADSDGKVTYGILPPSDGNINYSEPSTIEVQIDPNSLMSTIIYVRDLSQYGRDMAWSTQQGLASQISYSLPNTEVKFARFFDSDSGEYVVNIYVPGNMDPGSGTLSLFVSLGLNLGYTNISPTLTWEEFKLPGRERSFVISNVELLYRP